MTNDKELVEVWKKQFEEFCEKERISTKISPDGEMYAFSSTACLWGGWIAAKRSQPIVVLPNNAEINHLAVDTAGEYDWNTIEAKEKYIKAFTDGAIIIFDDISRILTAAGIKYTIGE